MNRRESPNSSKPSGEWDTKLNRIDSVKFKQKLLRYILRRFASRVILFTVILALLSIGLYYLGHSLIIWKNVYDFLYVFLKIFDNNWLIVLGIIWIIGFIIIMIRYWRITIGYIQAMSDAIYRLFEKDTQLIQLPAELKEIEESLNHIKFDSVRNEQLAREAEQRKNDLVVYLAHDLKTPLTSVIGYLTLLRDEPQISDALKAKYLSVSVEKALRLEELINEFFDITRFSLKGLTLEPARINLARMLEQMADEFKPLLLPKNLACVVAAPDNLVIRADANKLERVFDNLIRNAINYSYANTRIDINVIQSREGTLIRIQNHGDTIPEQKLKLIFEQFYRLDTARTTERGGAGLGLAIAKELVELHGGKITAASKDDIIQFEVFLPLS